MNLTLPNVAALAAIVTASAAAIAYVAHLGGRLDQLNMVDIEEEIEDAWDEFEDRQEDVFRSIEGPIIIQRRTFHVRLPTSEAAEGSHHRQLMSMRQGFCFFEGIHINLGGSQSAMYLAHRNVDDVGTKQWNAYLSKHNRKRSEIDQVRIVQPGLDLSGRVSCLRFSPASESH